MLIPDHSLAELSPGGARALLERVQEVVTQQQPSRSSSSSSSKLLCSICRDVLDSESEYVVQTPCSHRFHLQCLQNWALHSSGRGGTKTCPLCRDTMPKGLTPCKRDDEARRAAARSSDGPPLRANTTIGNRSRRAREAVRRQILLNQQRQQQRRRMVGSQADAQSSSIAAQVPVAAAPSRSLRRGRAASREAVRQLDAEMEDVEDEQTAGAAAAEGVAVGAQTQQSEEEEELENGAGSNSSHHRQQQQREVEALHIAQINQQRILDAESEALDEAEAELEMEFASQLYRAERMTVTPVSVPVQ